MAGNRLLNPKNLPLTLWDAPAESLRIPVPLTRAYTALIDRHGLRELATRSLGKGPVGGPTKTHTDEHFAQAFDSSVARAQLALLDPKNDIPDVSNAYIEVLAGNSLSLTDAPCGAGAAALSFLSTIAELRAQKVLPREPLDVTFIGAEISVWARRYAEELFSEVQPFLEEQAVFVRALFASWDVTDDLSNTDLIKSMTNASQNHSHRLLIVANFNGYLEREEKRKAALPKLAELFRHTSGSGSIAIWIEPQMNTAVSAGGLFPWLKSLLSSRWRRFARIFGGAGADLCSIANYYLALFPDRTAVVRLAVIPLDLARRDQ